jgi:hypothetical protein
MVEYFTALVLAYEVQGTEIETLVWFQSEDHCQLAMDRGVADPLYDELYSLYGNDIAMSCEVSGIASRVVRPKARPEVEHG